MRKLKMMDSHGVPIYHKDSMHSEHEDYKNAGMKSDLGTMSGGHGEALEEDEEMVGDGKRRSEDGGKRNFDEDGHGHETMAPAEEAAGAGAGAYPCKLFSST
jgi:hypothetical protein